MFFIFSSASRWGKSIRRINSGNNAYCLGQTKSELHKNTPKNKRTAANRKNLNSSAANFSVAGGASSASAKGAASGASNAAASGGAGNGAGGNGNFGGGLPNLPLPKSAH